MIADVMQGESTLIQSATALGVILGPILIAWFQYRLAKQARDDARQLREAQVATAKQAREDAKQAKQDAAKAAAAAKDAAEKTELVRQDLSQNTQETQTQLKEIKDTSDKVHVLVNNSMSMALRSNALLARRLADLPGASEADKAAAEAAEAASRDHEAKQRAVDAAEKKA